MDSSSPAFVEPLPPGWITQWDSQSQRSYYMFVPPLARRVASNPSRTDTQVHRDATVDSNTAEGPNVQAVWEDPRVSLKEESSSSRGIIEDLLSPGGGQKPGSQVSAVWSVIKPFIPAANTTTSSQHHSSYAYSAASPYPQSAPTSTFTSSSPYPQSAPASTFTSSSPYPSYVQPTLAHSSSPYPQTVHHTPPTNSGPYPTHAPTHVPYNPSPYPAYTSTSNTSSSSPYPQVASQYHPAPTDSPYP